MGALPVLNEPKGIATELEVVALLVDAERAVTLDINTPLDVGNHVLQLCLARRQPDIGDAHNGNAAPAIGPVRPA